LGPLIGQHHDRDELFAAVSEHSGSAADVSIET